MNVNDFHALKPGMVELPDGSRAKLSVVELGRLRVMSGRLGACDPFAGLDAPFVTAIPPGEYPVRVTVADLSDEPDDPELVEAFLSLILSDATATRVVPAPGLDGEVPQGGDWFGIGVDSGTVAFVDAAAVGDGMPDEPASWYSAVYDNDSPDSWFNAMDSHSPTPFGTANVPLPLSVSGDNLILCHSGWGDGYFPVLLTTDGDGELLGVHIDLLVVGPEAQSDD